jgi:hypothetical protein
MNGSLHFTLYSQGKLQLQVYINMLTNTRTRALYWYYRQPEHGFHAEGAKGKEICRTNAQHRPGWMRILPSSANPSPASPDCQISPTNCECNINQYSVTINLVVTTMEAVRISDL